MSKKASKENTIFLSAESLKKAAAKLMASENADSRSISIRDAAIKDDFVNYTYEIVSGKSIGFTHNVKGKGIIMESLRDAFAKLNVHLAVIDDVFKHSGSTIEDIDSMHNDDLSLLYLVTGFSVRGDEENEAVVLMGNKYLSTGSRMDLKSPKIAIDELSSYIWYNELRDAIKLCREEVALYHYGNYTPVQEEEKKEDPKQMSIMDEQDNGAPVVEFENGRM